MGRDLHILSRWESQGYRRGDLEGALQLYEGPPATLAIAQRNGNRFILNHLVEKHRKKQELDEMGFRVELPPIGDAA